MNNFNPGKTSDSFNPQNRTTHSPPDDQGRQVESSGSENHPALHAKTETAEQVWAQLEALQRKASERKKIDEAAKNSAAAPMTSSEPAYRTQPTQAPDRRSPSGSSAGNSFNRRDEKKSGVDPELFEKLGPLNRRVTTGEQINKAAPATILTPGPCVDGEWTALHLLVLGNRLPISDLIASGASVNAMSSEGITLLHMAIHTGNSDLLHRLLAAGANPLTRKPNQLSPLACALKSKRQFALALAEALPTGAAANIYVYGITEVHLAANLPEVLYAMLSKGMTDSANANGTTALMCAAEDGHLQSVKYLLGQRPHNENKSDFLNYLNRTDEEYGVTALSMACCANHIEIVELLLRHGASLHQPSDQSSLLKYAAGHNNVALLKLLLENGAAAYEADLPGRLFKAVTHGQTDFVSALAPHTQLNHKQQIKLLTKWMQNRSPEMLAAVSPLISPTAPDIRTLSKGMSFLRGPFTENSPELLVAMLEFFDQRDSFNFVLQSYISTFLEGQDEAIDPAMGKTLLSFALPRFSRLSTDRETVMRLLQLSEQLKDYTLITEIKARNFSGKKSAAEKIPFSPAWINDPVSLELLGLPGVREEQDTGPISNLIHTVASWLTPSDETNDLDGAQLLNDLILALKSDSIGLALDKTFETHRVSAVIRQALRPLLKNLATGLYPKASDRRESVGRLLIAYTLSTLTSNPQFSGHPAIALIESNPQWKSMKIKVDADIEAIEQVASIILETIVSDHLGENLSEVVTRLTIDTQTDADQEAFLTDAFRSTLGLLEFPARRLAQACVQARQSSQASSTSSTTSGATHASSATRPDEMVQLKPLIAQQWQALQRRSVLDPQLSTDLQALDIDVIDSYQNIVWWQVDKIGEAFSADDDDSTGTGTSVDDESSREMENEKS